MQNVSIFSLTPAGQRLAERLNAIVPGSEHLHRPHEFRQTVVDRFRRGHRLAMVCASGIVLRVLGPVLEGKDIDPAVLVLDEGGRFVVPLLSGHQGGGNQWAQELAVQLNARCVITSAHNYQQDLRVGGVGCSRGCSASQLFDLITDTLQAHSLDLRCLSALASIQLKADEPGLQELSYSTGLPLYFHTAAELRQYEHRLGSRSDIVFRVTGCYGVAEAAALASCEKFCGSGAELEISKVKSQMATFALARSTPGMGGQA